MNELSNLRPPKGAVTKAKRVGRGPGSGVGKTCGRGQKGQKSRSGGSIPPWFEGGQMPLQRRLPKRGFSNYVSKLDYLAIDLGKLDRFEDGATIDIEALKRVGLLKGHRSRVKIVGDGELSKKLIVKASRISKSGDRPDRPKAERRQEFVVVSASAADRIRAAGGEVEVG